MRIIILLLLCWWLWREGDGCRFRCLSDRIHSFRVRLFIHAIRRVGDARETRTPSMHDRIHKFLLLFREKVTLRRTLKEYRSACSLIPIWRVSNHHEPNEYLNWRRFMMSEEERNEGTRAGGIIQVGAAEQIRGENVSLCLNGMESLKLTPSMRVEQSVSSGWVSKYQRIWWQIMNKRAKKWRGVREGGKRATYVRSRGGDLMIMMVISLPLALRPHICSCHGFNPMHEFLPETQTWTTVTNSASLRAHIHLFIPRHPVFLPFMPLLSYVLVTHPFDNVSRALGIQHHKITLRSQRSTWSHSFLLRRFRVPFDPRHSRWLLQWLVPGSSFRNHFCFTFGHWLSLSNDGDLQSNGLHQWRAAAELNWDQSPIPSFQPWLQVGVIWNSS